MNYDSYSLADIAAATGNGNNGNGGFGEGYGAWWIIIFLIFAFGGFGNRGWGNNGQGGNGAADNYVLASDFAQISRQLDQGFDRIADSTTQINNGLCNGFYQELVNTNGINQNISNSTAALQSTLCQGFNGVNTNLMNNGYETRLGVQNLGSQLASCCCDIRQQISDCCCTTQRRN